MIVQCDAERLREARRFEPFARHESGLRRVMIEADIETTRTPGQMAMQATVSEPEELPGSYFPIDESFAMSIVAGPDGAVTAYGFDLGPAGSLL